MGILLTGATGFIGSAVLRAGTKAGMEFRAVARSRVTADQTGMGTATVIQSTLDGQTKWQSFLKDVRVVVHCAGRAHMVHDDARNSLTEYRRVNVEGTLNLARQAAAAGVRRFVFLSSVNVNGDCTLLGCPFVPDGEIAPSNATGISKAEAEAGLRRLAHATKMEVVIIRPVTVYGPGAKGNIRSMVRWVERNRFLPLGNASSNRRSFVGLDNLVDLILVCITHPSAANQIFLVSDDDDLSTAELLRRMGRAIEHPARLLPVPIWSLRLAARALGKGAVAERLLGSLQVDISKTRTLLGWTPPLTVDEGLRALSEADR